MNQYFKNLRNNFIQSLIIYQENQIILNRTFIQILEIQKALLSFSYLLDQQSSSYLTLLSYLIRPQIIIPTSNIFQYISFMICLFFFLNILFRIKNQYINLFGIILKTAIFNFFFEFSKGEIQIIVHIILILQYIFIEFVAIETQSINTINFQQTKIHFIDYLIIIFNALLIILNSYSNSQAFIYILAFLLNFCNMVSILFYENSANILFKGILINIYLYTFYFGIIDVSKYNKNLYHISLLLIILTYKILITYFQNQFIVKYWIIQKKQVISVKEVIKYKEKILYFKKMKIIEPKNEDEKIIYSSILIHINKPFEAFIILNDIKQKKLNFLTEINVKLIYKECIDKINSNISKEQSYFNRITQASKELISSDQLKQRIQQLVLESMLDKIQCQNLLLSNQSFLTFQKYINYVAKILKVKKLLEKQYENQPSEKTQNILGFFYSEIMNDYLSAYLLFNVVTLSDDKINYDATYQEVFSNKMVYLIIKYDGNLIIANPSQEASNLLKIQNDFLIGKQIEYLIPPGISQQHNLLVENFFDTGASKFFRSIQKNSLYNSENDYMENYDFAFDINLTRELNFIIFIQPSQTKTMEIILNTSYVITCISLQLAQEFEFLNQISNYIGLNVKKILPKFPQKIEAFNYIEDGEIIFDQHEACQTSHQSSTISPYHTSYYIEQKILNGKCLYISLNFESFRKQGNQNRLLTTENTQNISQNVSRNLIYTDDMIFDENSVKIPQEINFQDRQLWSPYFDEENPQQNLFSNEQTNFINEVKLEFTNIKSFRSNEGLLIEQQKSIQPITQNIPFESFQTQNNKIVKDEDLISKDNEESQQKQINVEGNTQISKFKGILSSLYYKKYELMQKIKYLKSNSKNHTLFLVILIFCIIIQIIIQTVQLSQLDVNLKILATDIDLLQIKNLVCQPYESFLITRWTMFNYNAMLANKQLTKEEHTSLFKFPLSNLNLGFDLLESNFKVVGNRLGIQDFLQNTYLTVYNYISTGIGEPYNISLRNSISILLTFQYDLKMRYQIEGTIITDSPYVFYSYRNYIAMKSLFSQLNEEVITTTISKSEDIMAQTFSIYIVCFVCLFIIFPIAFHYFLNIQRTVNKYYSLIFNIEPEFLHHEISRLKYIVDKYNKDFNILFKFKLELDYREKSFGSVNQIKQHGNKKIPFKLYTFYFYNFFYFFVFILIIGIIVGNATLTYQEADTYLRKYPTTAKYYKAVSDIGTDIPTIYAQREVLYNISYIAPFLNQSYQNDLFKEIIDSLNRTNKFLITDQNLDEIFISDQFHSYLEQIKISNLCNYLPENLKNKSETICSIAMESNMQRGLTTILVYIINYITNDMDVSQFKNRTSYTYMNLEGAFLISNIIREVNINFHADLIQITAEYINFINIHNIVLIIALIIMILFTGIGLRTKLVEKLHLAQRIVYILPIKYIIFNHTFERNLRQLVQKTK